MKGRNTPIDHHGMANTIPMMQTKIFNGTDEFDVYLGADEYWLMGDNRLGSTDSTILLDRLQEG